MLASIYPELKPFEELAASFAEKELAKKVEEHDRYPFGPFFSPVLQKACEVGLLGITLPEDLGGTGQGMGTLCLVLDRICQVDSSLGGIIFANALSQEILIASGAGGLVGKGPAGADDIGRCLIASCAFANPAEMQKMPKAKKSGESFSLAGAIEYVVLGTVASRAVIPARSGKSHKCSFFLVDLGDKGVKKSEPVFSLGLHACPATDIEFDCVPAVLVGEEGKGQAVFDQVSRKMHAAAAAMSSGIMKGSFREALAYAKERFQGGREIVKWSEVAMILANLELKSKAADLCVAQACQAMEKGLPDWGRTCVAAALLIHELACEATTDGIQVLGGNGYMKDYGQEKRFRDAKQVQSLLGIAPLKKIRLIRDISS